MGLNLNPDPQTLEGHTTVSLGQVRMELVCPSIVHGPEP